MSDLDAVLAELRFDDAGLVAAIAQDADDGEVLMMAWMNADAVRETLETGRVCYWSRSRRYWWRPRCRYRLERQSHRLARALRHWLRGC